ncbi:MBL fold metallo-hydrolase [Candidatus Bathyarchaeota archaeon]|nr:MBL fold metallo-hydrolase [Candidatus Bathyarchaeota archaeon]
MADDVCLTILIEDSVEARNGARKRLIAKHGLSILAETRIDDTEICVLMDTGPSAEALLNNVDIMDVNPRKIDAIVLSHGHYDHTDGLIGALKGINKPTMIIAHPKIFAPKFAVRKKLKFIGSSFTQPMMENVGGVPLFASNPVEIAEDITTTGEIERKTTYEKLKGFFTIEQGQFVVDSIIDDQALIINLKSKGLVVVTGCAHAGVVNTTMHAQKITNTGKIHAVLGGFHLIDATDKRIQMTIDDLKRLKPKFLGPCHSTGKKQLKKLKKLLEIDVNH